MNKKVILIILDGWGKSPDPKVSAVDKAHTPFIDSLYKKYPHALLRTDGMHVGLPQGQMGNSEVGHTNIGAGRVVYQDFAKINLAVEKGTLKNEATLQQTFKYTIETGKNLHFLGLLSNGGVHSHINHLKGLIDAAEAFGVKKSYIHAFTDGRDVDPKSGKGFVQEIEHFTQNKNVKLASIIGRYYAMDRDKRWERTKLAYDLLVNGIGKHSQNAVQSIQESYDANITDEFIKPIVLTDGNNKPLTTISHGDALIFFNFRTDRGRQLTQALSQCDFKEYDMHALSLYYTTMTNYDENFRNVHVVFDKAHLTDTLGEVLSKVGKKQIRIAETEKYPHVTFFFNGGQETPFQGEKRILYPSPKVATYDLKPQMSAYKIKDAIVPELNKGDADFICLNFANPDMVGHTGNMQAAVKACEVVDQCTEAVVNTALKNNYSCIIIADHGNCETMINPDGSPNTAHTINPVPVILVDDSISTIKNGILASVAPTIIKLMGLEQPALMTQNPLI